ALPATALSGASPSALRAARSLGGGEGTALNSGDLASAVAAALARVQAAGASGALLAHLAAAQYLVADLAPGDLGLADPAANRVLLSPNASRYGWFVDPTPNADEE